MISLRILKILERFLRRIWEFDKNLIMYKLLEGDLGNDILDVGSKTFSPNARKLRNDFGNSIRMVALDISPNYLSEGRRKYRLYDDYIIADARRLPFRTRSLDVTLCFEVIEHLIKSDGPKLLGEIERVARRRVIMSTPVGFMPARTHKSGWEPYELLERGYKIHGVIGSFTIRGVREFRGIGKYVCFPATWLSYTFAPFFYLFPKQASQVMCMKKSENITRYLH